MKKFILKSSYYVDNNFIVYVKLFPDDIFIENTIASNHELINKSDIDLQISELITEMTPILFDKFQNLDSVPLEVKNQYEL